MKITLCVVHLNRFSELQTNLRATCPHVDRTIISDGGSTDGSLEWLESQEARDLKIEVIKQKQKRLQYGNHTPEARNPYLDRCDTGPGNWILCLDSDEFLEEKTLPVLRQLAESAEVKGYNKICLQAHDIWSYEDGRVYDNLSNYHHHSMFFKAWQGMHYAGHTHSGVVRPGLAEKPFDSTRQYLHKKTEKRMWLSSTFLYWTSSKPATNTTNDPTWLEFHELMKKYGLLDWHDFLVVMERGNVPEDIQAWFVSHRDDENPEIRAWFNSFYIFLHPELNTPGTTLDVNKEVVEFGPWSNRDYQWNYLSECQRKKSLTASST